MFSDNSANSVCFYTAPAWPNRIVPFELQGYAWIYDGLIFFPAGALFGMALIPIGLLDIPAYVFLAVEFFAPPWLLDRILAHVSGRSISPRSILLSLVLVVAGALWINADRRNTANGALPTA